MKEGKSDRIILAYTVHNFSKKKRRKEEFNTSVTKNDIASNPSPKKGLKYYSVIGTRGGSRLEAGKSPFQTLSEE